MPKTLTIETEAIHADVGRRGRAVAGAMSGMVVAAGDRKVEALALCASEATSINVANELVELDYDFGRALIAGCVSGLNALFETVSDKEGIAPAFEQAADLFALGSELLRANAEVTA